jgi:hypothetical protein
MLVVPALVAKLWKPAAIGIIAIGAFWAFDSWRDNLVDAADARGFARAEQQYKAAVQAADERAAADTRAIQTFADTIGSLTNQRQQALSVSITPQTQRITDEVASDSRYRDCSVSDGVLNAANAARAAADASIASSNPLQH